MAVDGTYNVEIQAPMGTVTGILRIKAEGKILSGSYEAHGKAQPLTGTITGNNLTFLTAVGDPPQQIKLEFEGKVADNLITGGARADGSEPSSFRGTKA
jgi:hypothetical protein